MNRPHIHDKTEEMLNQMHEMIAEAIVRWRLMADDPEVIEGTLRNHLRQTTNVIEQLVHSHAVQHDMLKYCRRSWWYAMALAGGAILYHFAWRILT